MSKLVEKLRSIVETSASPLGFRTAARAAKSPPMLLIASLPKVDVELAAAFASGGVDAGLVPVANPSMEVATLKQFVKAMGEVPVGVLVESIAKSELEQLQETGCDFITFASKAPLVILREEGIGKILKVESSLEEGVLRSINQLPVDAVLLGEEEESFITVQRLMLWQRFAALLHKPLLVTVPSGIAADDLQNLREAGVAGVVVPAEIKQLGERLAELRRAIDTLPPLTKRKPGKATALLPRLSGEMVAEVEEEEEEDLKPR